MSKLYAIHPGTITSQYDGEIHYINEFQLAELYKLKPYQYIVWDSRRPETYLGRNKEDYKHLYPSYRGYYDLAKRKEMGL